MIHIGHASNIGDTCDISDIEFQAYDIIIVHAGGTSGGAAPSLGAGFTNIISGTQADTRVRVGYKIADGTETDVGTWTNSNDLQVDIYRGADTVDPIGASALLDSGLSGNSACRLPALTLEVGAGTSWLLGRYYRDGGTVYNKTFTGATRRSDSNSPDGPLNAGAWDFLDYVGASFPQTDATTTVTGGSRWTGVVIELLTATTPPPESEYTWTIVSGTLPTGLSLDPDTGVISGTPTVAGWFNFVIIKSNNYFSTQPLECSMFIGGVSEDDSTWSFDLARMRREERLFWHRFKRTVTRPAFIESMGTWIYADENDDVVRIDKAGLAEAGEWVSPTLNRPEMYHEQTLKELELRYYSSGETQMQVQASGDGGVTWVASERLFTYLATTSNRQIKRVKATFNVTGGDLRFRVLFPDDYKVRIMHYDPKIITRDDLATQG